MGQPLVVADVSTLTSWNADWRGLRVAVFGVGVTGFAAADTLAELGADVLVIASTVSDQHRDLLSVIGAGFVRADDVPAELPEFDAELVVVSPGYHPDHPLLLWAGAHDIPIWGDIELAWRLRDKVVRDDGTPAEWICVTGTNGKTTTTQLAATMLVAGGLRAAPAGNIGIPVLDAIRDPGGFDALVIELSSYQLHWMHRGQDAAAAPAARIAPLAAVCLNLADDHFDWHGSAAAYRDAKAKVYENVRVACVYNLADEATRTMVEEAEVQEGARAIGFGPTVPGPERRRASSTASWSIARSSMTASTRLSNWRPSTIFVPPASTLLTRSLTCSRPRRWRGLPMCRPRRSATPSAGSAWTRTAPSSSQRRPVSAGSTTRRRRTRTPPTPRCRHSSRWCG